MSEVRSGLPEELELLAPGAGLAALLDSVDRRLLSGKDRVRLAQARNRLASYLQARLLEDLYAISWEEPPAGGVVMPEQASRYPWAETEIAFAMRWTRTAAGGRLEQARELIEDLPAVQAALLAGDIDMPNGQFPLVGIVAHMVSTVHATRTGREYLLVSKDRSGRQRSVEEQHHDNLAGRRCSPSSRPCPGGRCRSGTADANKVTAGGRPARSRRSP